MNFDSEHIISIIMDILRKIQTLGTDALTYTQAYNAVVVDRVNQFNIYAVKPLASILLSMFAMMQIYKSISYLNEIGAPQGGSARLETLGFTLAKIGFIYWLITKMSNFIWGLVYAGNWLIAQIQSVGAYSTELDLMAVEGTVRAIVQENEAGAGGFMDNLLTYMTFWIVGIIIWIAAIVVFVLFYARMIQIFIMVALSPIPIVTFLHDEHKQVGIFFVKSFCAVLLQGAVMVLCIYLYSALVSTTMLKMESLQSIVWSAAGIAILLVVSLASSGPLSKRIVNAM